MNIKILLTAFTFWGVCDALKETVTAKKGFCVTSWTTRNATYEPYTYTRREMRDEYCGWRVCKKEHIRVKTDTRLVFRDVLQSRVVCCEGYQKTDIDKDHFDCEPICEPVCSNGHCSGPGNCTCFHGYEHATASLCVASCKPECVNADCSAPGTCKCHNGYYQVNGTYCAPNCSSPCINGICFGPDECLCNPGYDKNATDPFTCDPICSKECVNSKCVNVDECECIEGYVKKEPNVCIPSCNLECLHGYCSAPNTCTCDEGYFLDEKHWFLCLPNCNCTNGFCQEPNKCICHENYTLNEGDCEPVCENCINATCTSPYMCECLKGFKRLNDTTCTPECSNCVNGVCAEPELCYCFPGYESSEGTCKPICEFGCANGICKAPNECSCESQIEKIEENLCFPVCGTNCSKCPEEDCFEAERTQINFPLSSSHIDPFLRLHLKINCSELYQNNSLNCDIDSNDKTNCSGITLECTAVQNPKYTFKFICIWTEISQLTNITYESYYTIYEEIIPDILYEGHLNKSKNKNEIPTTILLPKSLITGEEICDLCSFSSNNDWQQTNKLTLKFLPCPKNKQETLKSEDNHFEIVAGLLVGLVALILIIGVIYSFYKGKLYEYMVNSKNEHLENEISDEAILTQETEN